MAWTGRSERWLMLLCICFPKGPILCRPCPCPLDLWCALLTYCIIFICAGQGFCHAACEWPYGTYRFCNQMSLLHSAALWGETAFVCLVLCLQCMEDSGRVTFWLGRYLFFLSLCHICFAIAFLAFLPLFQYVLQWKCWHILKMWRCLLLMNVLSHFWLSVSTSLITFLLPELIRAGVTHSSMGLGWPLALCLCKKVYHAFEPALSHEELQKCSGRRSRSYCSCEQSHSYQAISGMYLCLVYLKYVLVLPLWAMQRENFHISFLFHAEVATGFVSECFACSIQIFSCSVFIFTVQQSTSPSSSADVWNQISGLCRASLLYCGV